MAFITLFCGLVVFNLIMKYALFVSALGIIPLNTYLKIPQIIIPADLLIALIILYNILVDFVIKCPFT